MNVVMSMKGDRKPVSFIEDCTVPLEHLSEYGARLEDVFRRHGTSGTLVCPRLGRVPPRSAHPESQAGPGPTGHARHRGGGA